MEINYSAPVEDYRGNQLDPIGVGLIKSPCLCVPETGLPCELSTADKDNPLCLRCTWRLGYGGRNSTQDERKALAYNLKNENEITTHSATRYELHRRGIKLYYDEKKLCQRGHTITHDGKEVTKRYTQTGKCVQCARKRVQRWQKINNV